MKAIKSTLALSILGAIILVVLRILGAISDTQAIDTGGKVIGVILAVGIGLGIVMMLLESRKPSGDSEQSNEAGPKF